MVAPDTLITPFESWQDGLRKLADSLGDPELTAILVSRLDATAQLSEITLNDICALALLTQSSARFEPTSLPIFEPHSGAVEMAKKLGGTEVEKVLIAIVESQERTRSLREAAVNFVFAENDSRRLLKDTIFGFATAELSDTKQKMGETDPFTRLSHRLSFWFRSSDASPKRHSPVIVNYCFQA